MKNKLYRLLYPSVVIPIIIIGVGVWGLIIDNAAMSVAAFSFVIGMLVAIVKNKRKNK